MLLPLDLELPPLSTLLTAAVDVAAFMVHFLRVLLLAVATTATPILATARAAIDGAAHLLVLLERLPRIVR